MELCVNFALIDRQARVTVSHAESLPSNGSESGKSGHTCWKRDC